MNHIVIFVILMLTFSLTTFGQKSEPIPWQGMYVIQKKGQPKSGENIFENPENMPDRMILDSSKKAIARKTSSPFGYIYYEWKNKNHKKSYQEIGILNPKIKIASMFTDSGEVALQKSSENWILYFVVDNPLDLIEGIRIPESKRASDSLTSLYRIPAETIAKGRFWTSFSFYESGTIKSTGTVFLILDKTLEVYKIGKWLYYDGNGQLFHAENFRQLKKVDR